MSDQNRLNEIRARLSAATPGPWQLIDRQRRGRRMVFVKGGFGLYNVCDSSGEMDGLDATFIANAPSDIEWLLGEVERLERR